MKRILSVALGAALMTMPYGPRASAEDVCNYGRMASNAATSSGSYMRAFTQSSGPMIVTTGAGASNQVNIPPGQRVPVGCSSE
jgi:hypothetical protein